MYVYVCMAGSFYVNILSEILVKEPSGKELWAWHSKKLLVNEGAGVSSHSDTAALP